MWGAVEVEPEVEQWLRGLSGDDFGHVQFYVDLLEREGVALGEPYTRRLRGKLRELRFYLGRERRRITYYVARGRRQILLTVFAKQQDREAREIDRAERAMMRCIEQGHEAEE
ncbi:MAG TPA: type II toxin-antitoxin system RelE/ParE family toxin [Candidatus Limnocylindria bacterium]|nr:type II toxin-antitoxin system RelE/ParE family toxin [Candidatus Limnocylindria bacterium]